MKTKKQIKMKKLLFCLMLTPLIGNAQTSVQMRTGYNFKTVDAFISGAVNFKTHGFGLSPEMIVLSKQDAPVSFGLKMSYTIGSFEAGAGRYFDLINTDPYPENKLATPNGWSNDYFISYTKGIFFIEYEYKQGHRLSIGIKEEIF